MRITLLYIFNVLFGIASMTGGVTYFLSLLTQKPQHFWVVYIFSFLGLVIGIVITKKKPDYKISAALFILAILGIVAGEIGMAQVKFN